MHREADAGPLEATGNRCGAIASGDSVVVLAGVAAGALDDAGRLPAVRSRGHEPAARRMSLGDVELPGGAAAANARSARSAAASGGTTRRSTRESCAVRRLTRWGSM